ncbi:MAG: serine/threonine-protein kinase, partial [Kofleriaceae bacterium]
MIAGTEIGAYRLLEKIGEGGMGAVWRAEHTKLGRLAAIKVLHPSFSMRPEIVTRFFNEAKAATAISDPGIVQIFDFGNHTDGSAYLVMELLEGETLRDRLDHAGPMSATEALRVLRQVSTTIGAAHTRGIVHRDLKPENIFLVRDPEVAGGERAKVLDFGIAKLIGDPTQTQQTNASLVLGTPAYMSPEQCRGAGQVDQRSDVYALGCVFFALLTKRPPFVAAGGGELIAMHLVNDPPRPSEFVANVPASIEAVIMKCLEKEPRDRYLHASELAGVLATLDGTGPALRHPVAPVSHAHDSPAVATVGSVTTLAAATGMTAVTRQGPSRSRRNLWLLIGGGLCIAGVAGGLASLVMTSGSNELAPPPPSPSVEPISMTVTAIDAHGAHGANGANGA